MATRIPWERIAACISELAAGAYDGTWQVDATPAGAPGSNTAGTLQC